jgi:hypothetical protein
MTDQPIETSAADASAGAPVTQPPVDVAAIEAALTAKMNERFAGFQRVIAEKDQTIGSLSNQLEEFKSAGLSDAEREQLREQKLRAENAALRAQLDLVNLTPEFPDEMPLFRELMTAKSAQDQLAVIRRIRSAAKAAPVVVPETPAEAEEESGTIDPNNPARTASYYGGGEMTDAVSEAILKGFGGTLASVTHKAKSLRR